MKIESPMTQLDALLIFILLLVDFTRIIYHEKKQEVNWKLKALWRKLDAFIILILHLANFTKIIYHEKKRDKLADDNLKTG